MTGTAIPVRKVKREEPEWVVIVVVVVALLFGWLLKMSVENRAATFANSDLTLSYPATWLRDIGAAEGDVLNVHDMQSGSPYSTHLTVEVADVALLVRRESVDPMTMVVTAWTLQRGQELESYRVLSTEVVEVDGIRGTRIDYTFVSEPVANPYRKVLPVVVEAFDYLLPYQDKVYVITLAADGYRFEEAVGDFEAILRSVDFTG